jgi:hypothetical protein
MSSHDDGAVRDEVERVRVPVGELDDLLERAVVVEDLRHARRGLEPRVGGVDGEGEIVQLLALGVGEERIDDRGGETLARAAARGRGDRDLARMGLSEGEETGEILGQVGGRDLGAVIGDRGLVQMEGDVGAPVRDAAYRIGGIGAEGRGIGKYLAQGDIGDALARHQGQVGRAASDEEGVHGSGLAGSGRREDLLNRGVPVDLVVVDLDPVLGLEVGDDDILENRLEGAREVEEDEAPLALRHRHDLFVEVRAGELRQIQGGRLRRVGGEGGRNERKR